MTPEDRIHELETQLDTERDRRYTEVQAERDKATGLARQMAQEKDDRMDGTLQRILERIGQCTTHEDFEAFRKEREMTLKPLMEFVAAQQGRDTGSSTARSTIFAVLGVLVGAMAVWAGLRH